MIKLAVKSYCHNCPYFEPFVKESNGLERLTLSDDVLSIRSDSYVTCVHDEKCSRAVKEANK